MLIVFITKDSVAKVHFFRFLITWDILHQEVFNLLDT